MNIWLFFFFSLKFPIRKPTKRPLSSTGVRLPSQRFYLLLHESNGAPMLGLLAVSRVDAVSVLGTLSRDKAAVPGRLECCRSRGGRESGVEGQRGRGRPQSRAAPYLRGWINWYRRQRSLLHSRSLWLQTVVHNPERYLVAALDKWLFIAGFGERWVLSPADARAASQITHHYHSAADSKLEI